MGSLPRTAALVLASALLAAACSLPGTRAPDPGQVLRDAARAMSSVRSVTADVKLGGGVTYQGVTLSSATSKIKLPDESDTVFKVKQGDFLVDLRAITVGGHVYLRLPLASQYIELDSRRAAELPNLAGLLDSSSGLPALLPQGRQSTYAGGEQVGGVACDRVDATYPAALVSKLLGAQLSGDVKASFWVAQSDHLIRRALLTFQLNGKPVQAQIDLHDFNQPLTVAAPANVAPPPSPTPSP